MIETSREKKEPTDLIPIAEMELVGPASIEKIIATFRGFERMRREILTDADWQKIGDKIGMNKTGALKMALSCNISLEKREERVEKEDDEIVYHYTFRAVHLPTGRFADADGSASSNERNFARMPHDLRTLAQTRACSRAIINLTGGGVLAAEEMTSGEGVKPSPPSVPKTIPNPNEVSALAEVALKDGWTWNQIFQDYGPRIEARQNELGPLFSFDMAAVVFAREQLLVKTQELPQ